MIIKIELEENIIEGLHACIGYVEIKVNNDVFKLDKFPKEVNELKRIVVNWQPQEGMQIGSKLFVINFAEIYRKEEILIKIENSNVKDCVKVKCENNSIVNYEYNNERMDYIECL